MKPKHVRRTWEIDDAWEPWQKHLFVLFGVVVESEVLPLAEFARLLGKSRHGLNTRFHQGLLPGMQEPGGNGSIHIFVKKWAEGLIIKGMEL